MCYSGTKVVSKFDTHHIARLPHPIHQTWARTTFGSSGCWKESWRIESFIHMMKLKRRLRRPGMTSHSMRSRASFTIGWIDWDRPLSIGKSALLNKDGSVYFCLLSDGIGGPGTFFIPYMESTKILSEISGPQDSEHINLKPFNRDWTIRNEWWRSKGGVTRMHCIDVHPNTPTWNGSSQERRGFCALGVELHPSSW
jgi:hypothetical protein